MSVVRALCLPGIVLILTLLADAGFGFAQVVGEVGEMERLEQRANDAIANGDPEGAALASGKAALMAAFLAQKEEHETTRALYEAGQTLYRGQEKGYRALALFERAGGQPPASAGVCQYLSQAADMIQEAQNQVTMLPDVQEEHLSARRDHYLAMSNNWNGILQGLQQDFVCSPL